MKEHRQILFRGAVHASTKGVFHYVWPAPQVSLATFATRFRRLVLSGSFDEQGIEEALMLDVPSFRRKYGVRKTFAEIDGQRVDLHALFSAQPGEVRVKYSIARQRCRSLQRLGPLSMIGVEDAFRLNGAAWKTAYGGGRHRAFVYVGREFPELIGRDFHGISAFLLAIGRYGDRALVWGRMKAGWSLDSALIVPSAHPTSARTGTIYRVTRLRTGQFYIGLTVCYVGQRWAFHVRAAKAGQATKFAAAVRADGPEGFVVDVLEQGIVGSEKLAEREKYWTEKLGSFGDMGLNTAPAGGLGGPRGISTEVNGEVFVSKNEAAQVLAQVCHF